MRARVALVCHRRTLTGPVTVEATYWDSVEQARQAEAELSPCSPLCVGVHSVVRVDLEPDSTRGLSSRTRTTRTAGAVGAGT